MSAPPEFEPMDQDGDDDVADSLQVEVTNDLFKSSNDNEVELDFEADDLEITEFLKTDEAQAAQQDKAKQLESKSKREQQAFALGGGSPVENITISVIGPNDEDGEVEEDDSAKEDGEISETQSHSDAEEKQYFSRNSSVRSSRRRNDIRRERSPIARRYPNPYLELDDAKIQARALRFGSGTTSGPVGGGAAAAAMTEKNVQIGDEELLNLYINCGLIQDDGGKLTLDKVAPHHRLDSILIRGTNHMNTNEIFKYLYDLGQKPLTMEWVNDAMCVAIYANKFDAATSMLKTSKPIKMDPRLAERKRSIVQSTDNDKEENGEEKTESMNEDFDYDKVDAIPQSWITVPMPPGYVWRLGAPCEKAKQILVRFATKNDKKQERAERFSEFYQKYGNPNKAGTNRENSGNGENFRRRKKIRSEHGNFEPDRREKEEATFRESQMKLANPNDKNGWGQLSAMWDDEEAFQRSARDRITTARQRSKDDDTTPSGISPMKRPDLPKVSTPSAKPVDARDLLKTRQKRKRGTNSSDEERGSDSENDDNDRLDLNDWKDGGAYRKKRNSKVNEEEDDGDGIAWRERLTGPRMRMHADEEEERMKRRAFRRLGHKRGSDAGLQTNSWEFSRDSSSSGSFRTKAQARRPISERLGAKRIIHQNVTENDNGRDDDDNDDTSLSNQGQGGFDLRQKLINMRRTGNEEASTDEDEDLHNLIFYD